MKEIFSKKAGNYLLDDHPDLHAFYLKLKALDELNAHVSRHLHPDVRAHCQAANLVDGRLILIAANGSIATQLRYQIPELLTQFKSDPALHHIKDIFCKVRPPLARSQRKLTPPAASKMAPLSPQTAKMVDAMADSIDDPKLREVMKRIAQNIKK